jgi:benzodiazapine receptor
MIKNIRSLIVFLALCLSVSLIGGWITQTSVNDWYQTLVKPTLNPPDWVFAPTWVTLYVMMALSAWRIWLRSAGRIRQLAMLIFAIQLALNLAWSFIFFGAKSPSFAAIEIVALWITIFISLLTFSRIDRIAVWLMIPYLLWVSFAIYLNVSIYLLN